MYASTMSVFLEELSKRHPDCYILLIMDGAPCHRSGDLVVPKNIQIVKLPPYSPELNPAEHIWDAMREDHFRNIAFKSMDEVEKTMVRSLLALEEDRNRIKSMTGFPWILDALPA